nr:hypothetical protein [Desulfobulbaceae bacterium]
MFFSAIFVVTKPHRLKLSLLLLGITIILATLQFGSILAKLSPDFLLATYFGAMLWIIFSTEKTSTKLLTMSMPLLHLYLLKEIGIFLSYSLLAISFFMFVRKVPPRNIAKITTSILAIAGSVFFVKFSWQSYCHGMGFTQITTAVNKHSIINSLKIFSNETIWQGFTIFIKSITIGPADRLNLPFLFWYILLFFLWKNIIRESTTSRKIDYQVSLALMSLFFLVYLSMLYFMQIIVFNVGGSFDHTLGMTRYVNIYLGAIIFFTLVTSLGRHLSIEKALKTTWIMFFCLLITLFLVVSRNKRLEQDAPDSMSEKIANQIIQKITPSADVKIYVIPGNGENLLGLRLLYHLQPARVSYSSAPATEESLLRNLTSYDYCLLYNVSPQVTEWIEKITNRKFAGLEFYKIDYINIDGQNSDSSIKLQRLF